MLRQPSSTPRAATPNPGFDRAFPGYPRHGGVRDDVTPPDEEQPDRLSGSARWAVLEAVEMDGYPSLARRLWRTLPWSGNPLMRPADRFEGLIRLFAIVLVLAAVPLAGLAGTVGYTSAAARIRADNATKTLVQVAITSDPELIPAEGQTAASHLEAHVQWKFDGHPATATIEVPASAKRGDQVPMWLGPNGRPTGAPVSTGSAAIQGIGAGLLTLTGIICGAITLAWSAAWLLAWRNRAEWAREWQRMSRAIGQGK
ncbi:MULTISPECIES: hypothetical protein [unclassified Nocardia]|uniref:Rv1733c family protein n=1 Tax=unclassified Nocardia TaxID=2637762 RepID=UPI001CE45AA3|nr:MULTISPECIES: hypothetical protein [unclassified Nocardia]